MTNEVHNNNVPHLSFLGLSYNPFPVTPDIDDFFISEKTDQIITEIIHGIETRKGFLVLTGEVGLGKTTISRKILGILNEKKIATALVFHSFFQGNELIRQINSDFGLEPDKDLPEGAELERLNHFLLQQNSQGINCSIIIDDAQNLSYDSLELIRLISNLETDREKLVQILLIGQPELLEKLNEKKLRQLRSRIVIQHSVTPLSPDELHNYIHFKLDSAGGKSFFIDPKAVKTIYKATAGNLRRINILMDRCLYAAFARQSKKLDKGMVQKANKDLICFTPDARDGKHPQSLLIWSSAFVFFIVAFTVYTYLAPFSSSTPGQSSPASEETALTKESPAPSHLPQQSRDTAARPVPPAVTDFLQNYNLEEYDVKFWHAIRNDSLQELSAEIQDKKGYQLVTLPAVPDFLHSEFDLLQIRPASNKDEMYITFWKPLIEIKDFFWGYRGAEIIQLQYLLDQQGYSPGTKDGVVGKQLMQAVLLFQKDNGLPVTGRPDSAMLFILSNSGA